MRVLREVTVQWKNIALAAVVVSLCSCALHAQPGRASALQPFRLEHWRTEEGLPHGSIAALLQDQDGFLWVGTLRGLARFDGVRFESAPAHGRKIPWDVTALAQTPDRSIWIGTRNTGLVRLRGDSTRAYNRTTGFPGEYIRCLAAGPDGTLWIGTEGTGVIRVVPPYDDARAFTIADGLPANAVVDLAVGGDGTAVAVCAGGTVASITVSGTVQQLYPGGTEAACYAVSTWDNGRMLLGTTAGLLSWDGHSWNTLAPPPGTPGDYFNVLRPGRSGSIWTGMYTSGLLRFDPGKGPEVAVHLTRADGLAGNYIGCLLEDREGNLWIGTEDGLQLLRSVSVRMIAAEEGFDNEGPISLIEDGSGTVWVGTDGGGLYRIVDYRVETHLNTARNFPGHYLQTLALDREGSVLIGTDGIGILTPSGSALRRYPSGQTHASVSAMLIASDGALWTGGDGLLERQRGEEHHHFGRESGIPAMDIRALLEDRDGKIWVGTEGGLCTVTDTIVTRIGRAQGIPSDHITALYQDSTGAIWIGTAAGLARWAHGRMDVFDARSGLPDNTVSSILEDGRGHLWFASPTGIIRIARVDFDSVLAGRRRALRALVLGVEDGMETAECTDVGFPAGLRRENGELWFPTPRGLAIVDPNRLRLDTRVTTLLIEQLTTKPGNRYAGDTITLGPSERDFALAYNTPSFTGRTRFQFRYRLAGFDADWIDAGDRRVAYYTNVPPGTYRFEVTARAVATGETLASASMLVTVSPHFYQTFPFYLSAGLLLLLLLVGAHRYRVRQSERRAEELARQVDQRTKALQEEVAERRKAEAALRESEERQNAVMLLMPVVMYVASTPSEIDAEWMSGNVERITGFRSSDFTDIPRFWVSRVHPQDAHHLQKMMEQVRAGIAGSCEYRWLCADGQYRWFLDSVVSVRSTGDGISEYSGILLDNHERRLAEDRLRTSLREKEILLKEIHHRVKNNLTVISSLLNLQAGGSTDRTVIEVLRDASHRVGSMASIHEQLYRSDNLAAIDLRQYVERLTHQLARTFAAPGITIDVAISRVFLEINEAIPCGLIINELVTNALKYAFRERSSGRIVVSLDVAADGLHTLEVRDDGVGFDGHIDPEQAPTLGLRLVSLLAEQLGGTVRITRNHGTHCTIAFRPPTRP